MADNDIALMAHLMRRAGFGAPYETLEAWAAKGYEAAVEELLHPENQPDGIEMDVMERYFIEWRELLIDMQPLFETRHALDGSTFEFFPLDGHWNSLAHRMVTDAITTSEVLQRTFGASRP